jgi:hypothetical protein
LRGAATALALILALGAHAQTPPDTPATPQAQAPAATPPPAASAPSPADAAAGEAQPSGQSPPPVQVPPLSQPQEAAAAPRAAAPRAPVPHPQPAPPATPVADHEGELATLRAEVSRLQAELDAERAAAALPPVEEGGMIPAPVRSGWEWLVVAALLALAAGFVLGWRVLDRRIRRKYGGLRIY